MSEKEEPVRSLLSKHLAIQFRQNRKQLGLSQLEMAEYLSSDDVTTAMKTIQRWEKGESTIPAWAIKQQEMMLDYMGELKLAESGKKQLLKTSNDISNGLLPVLKNKVKGWLGYK